MVPEKGLVLQADEIDPDFRLDVRCIVHCLGHISDATPHKQSKAAGCPLRGRVPRASGGIDLLYVYSPDRLAAEDTVRAYKGLSHVEQAFRCLKTDLKARPIYHRTEEHVRAHFFLCILAYYLEWHLRKALAPFLFEDEELEDDRETRDPVAPAPASESLKRKKAERKTPEGFPIHDFRTLLAEMGTRCKNWCRFDVHPDAPLIQRTTEPTPQQGTILERVNLYPVAGN
jgi:hypothetical protein